MKTIFLHIPKAGGTTLHSVLTRIYPKETIHDILIKNGRLTTDEFIALPQTEKEKLKIVKGHMVFGLHSDFSQTEPVKYFSFLRNPVSRIVSQYNYILRRPDHYLHDKIVKNNLTLKQYALSDLSIELDNGQVRLISGYNDQAVGLTTSVHLESAIQNIKEHFSCIGFVEKFDDSLILLMEKLEVNGVPYYRKLNVTKEGTNIDQETRLAIEKKNDLDMQLYYWAFERFNKELDQVQDMEWKRKILSGTIQAYQEGFDRGQELTLKSLKTRKSRLDKFTSFLRRSK